MSLGGWTERAHGFMCREGVEDEAPSLEYWCSVPSWNSCGIHCHSVHEDSCCHLQNLKSPEELQEEDRAAKSAVSQRCYLITIC